jgi:hypothetical protein
MKRLLTCLAFVGAAATAPGCFLGDSCFVRGTRVLTPRGRRNIEDLVAGDEVVSFDVAARRFVVRRVARSLRALANEVFRVQAGEHVIEGVTAEHPFFEADTGTWVRTDALTLRSSLLVSLGQGEAAVVPVGSITRLPARGEIEVWNLSVEGDEQNYFAECVLVHNKSPIEPIGGAGGEGPATCPGSQPTSGDACPDNTLSCDYGEECCCGACYPSVSCFCSDFNWACLATDACLAPGCGGAGGSGGMGGTGGAGGAGGAGGVGGSASSPCTETGGTESSGLCCQNTGDFPDQCVDGPCGCGPNDSHEVKVCVCPDAQCYDAMVGCKPL